MVTAPITILPGDSPFVRQLARRANELLAAAARMNRDYGEERNSMRISSAMQGVIMAVSAEAAAEGKDDKAVMNDCINGLIGGLAYVLFPLTAESRAQVVESIAADVLVKAQDSANAEQLRRTPAGSGIRN
ncbi:MAG: hypothetical protein ACXU82_03675 [Caulobacteraceae bacterium]